MSVPETTQCYLHLLLKKRCKNITNNVSSIHPPTHPSIHPSTHYYYYYYYYRSSSYYYYYNGMTATFWALGSIYFLPQISPSNAKEFKDENDERKTTGRQLARATLYRSP